MQRFRYKALSKEGRESYGSIEAESVVDLQSQLRNKGLYLIEIVGEARRFGFKRIPRLEVAIATRQLATLLTAGLALVEALSVLADQLGDRPLGVVIRKVREAVKSGASFSDALYQHPRVFFRLYVNMVRAGEASGDLGTVLFRLADFMERQLSLRNRIQVLLTYPCLMVAIGCAVLFFLFTFVVPVVSEVFVQMHRVLPLPTLILIRLGSFFKKFWWIILGIGLGIIFFLNRFARTQRGGLFLDRFKLHIPGVGSLFLKAAISRFSRSLATLIGGGVELLSSLDIVKVTAGNRVISEAIDKVGNSVSKGADISTSLKGTRIFPPIVIHMVAAGEKSGELEKLLLKVADIYDEELMQTVNRIMAILEPGLILVMGLIVGFVVLAILLPIFEMSQLVR